MVGCRELCKSLLIYKSSKFIRVHNPALALSYYGAMGAILLYVIVFTIVISKGYQATDEMIGTTSIKVKGSASTGSTTSLDDMKVFTSEDLVLPSIEADAVFIATSVITTQQSEGIWTGNEDTGDCTSADDCEALAFKKSAGILTGECEAGFCKFKGWGPLEKDEDQVRIYNTDQFTVFVKVNGRFQKWEKDFTNAEDKEDSGAPVMGYNLFTAEDIINRAGYAWDDIVEKGGIVLFTTKYNCDLDKSDSCDPDFEIQRIDNLPGTISPGFNFRSAQYFYDNANNSTIRYLRKNVGLRVLFHINGVGSKFDLLALTTTIGAGMALLGVSTIICDIILENFLGEASIKYEKARNQDLNEHGGFLRTPLSRRGSERDISASREFP